MPQPTSPLPRRTRLKYPRMLLRRLQKTALKLPVLPAETTSRLQGLMTSVQLFPATAAQMAPLRTRAAAAKAMPTPLLLLRRFPSPRRRGRGPGDAGLREAATETGM